MVHDLGLGAARVVTGVDVPRPDAHALAGVGVTHREVVRAVGRASVRGDDPGRPQLVAHARVRQVAQVWVADGVVDDVVAVGPGIARAEPAGGDAVAGGSEDQCDAERLRPQDGRLERRVALRAVVKAEDDPRAGVRSGGDAVRGAPSVDEPVPGRRAHHTVDHERELGGLVATDRAQGPGAEGARGIARPDAVPLAEQDVLQHLHAAPRVAVAQGRPVRHGRRRGAGAGGPDGVGRGSGQQQQGCREGGGHEEPQGDVSSGGVHDVLRTGGRRRPPPSSPYSDRPPRPENSDHVNRVGLR